MNNTIRVTLDTNGALHFECASAKDAADVLSQMRVTGKAAAYTQQKQPQRVETMGVVAPARKKWKRKTNNAWTEEELRILLQKKDLLAGASCNDERLRARHSYGSIYAYWKDIQEGKRLPGSHRYPQLYSRT